MFIIPGAMAETKYTMLASAMMYLLGYRPWHCDFAGKGWAMFLEILANVLQYKKINSSIPNNSDINL